MRQRRETGDEFEKPGDDLSPSLPVSPIPMGSDEFQRTVLGVRRASRDPRWWR